MAYNSGYASRYAPSASSKSIDPKKESESSEFEKFAKLACMGFLGSGAQARKMKQMVICQWLFMAVFFYVYYRFNGGFWPYFLKGPPTTQVLPSVDLVQHFPVENADGSLITWKQAVNSKEELMKAMSSGAMMLEADVLLRGQDSPSQQLVPIVASPPHTDGDLTLKEWLQLAKNSTKGFKLDFKSIEAVDLSLQHLKELKEEIKVPVHLSATVLDGPNSHLSSIKSLDAHRFVRLCMTHFPQSTLALGWNTEVANKGMDKYDWSSVKAMYELIKESGLQQPVSFNVRAKFVRNSTPQLKWLMEMTKGSLAIYFQQEDSISMSDMVYVRHRIPMEKTYYLLPEHLQAELHSAKDNLELIPQDLTLDTELSFKASQWKIVKIKGDVAIYMGTETFLMGRGMLLSDEEHLPSDSKPVTVSGRVEFLKSAAEEKVQGPFPDKYQGIEVYVRAPTSTRSDSVSGIRCFLNREGEVTLSAQGIPGLDGTRQTSVQGTAPCFTFKITDRADKQIEFSVTRPKSCNSYDETDYEGVVVMPTADVKLPGSKLVVQKSDAAGVVAFDQLQIL